MKKRFTAILLILVTLFTLSPVQTFAAQDEDVLPRLQDCMAIVADAASVLEGDLQEGALSAGPMDAVAALKGAFTNFLSFAKTGAPVISLITGGVTFLRMIGVMEDPTQTALGNILSQLETMDQKISEINGKVDVITAQISAMQATEAFHNRGRKADTLNGYWRNFDETYMENGMDKLMSDYDAMVLNGLQNWFTNTAQGARTRGSVDNTQLVLVYSLNDKGDHQLTFSNENGVPTTVTEGDRYIVLSAACLPQPGDVTWNADTYRQAFIDFVAPRIAAALRDGTDAVETNYAFAEADAADLAADAVDMLIFRVACAEVNTDAAFVSEVNRQFTNYCTRLLSSENGMDAMFKSLYLTHAFQFQIREDLQKFCDRMIVKTGTYGAFVTNVLSMSRSMNSAAKLGVVTRFCDTIEAMDSAKSRCVVSAYDNQGKFYRYYDNYCYLTNSQLYYVDASLDAEVTVRTEESDYGDGKVAYRSYSAQTPVLNMGTELPDGSAMLDDTNTLLLLYTLKSNGVSGNFHDYFVEKDIDRGIAVSDYGYLLTSYSVGQDLPLDGSVLLRCHLVAGNDSDYFKNYNKKDMTIKSSAMPGDTEEKYVVYHKKVSGSLCDLKTGTLSANQTLLATAVYGESHALWYVDESALFAGPSNASNFASSLYREKTAASTDSSWWNNTLRASRKFNVLYAVPVPSEFLSSPGAYEPLQDLSALNSQLNESSDPASPTRSADPKPTVTSAQTADSGVLLFALSGALSLAGLHTAGTHSRRKTK